MIGNIVAGAYGIGVPPAPPYPGGVTPEVWLDASNSSTITLNGSTVSQWTDLSPNGYTFTQGTASYQPTLVSAGLNSKNTISYGGNDVLVSTASAATWKFFNDGTKYLVCMVAKFQTQSGYLLITDAASGANAGGRIIWETGGALNNATVNAGEAGTFSFSNTTANSTYASDTWKNVGILADPANGTAASRSSIKFNNGSSIANNTLTNNNANQNPASTWYLGSYLNDGITDRMIGSIAEIVVIKATDATDSNRTAIYTYLNTKWGI
jgi:hypothetical protein